MLNAAQTEKEAVLQPLQLGFLVLALYGSRHVAELVLHQETHLKIHTPGCTWLCLLSLPLCEGEKYTHQGAHGYACFCYLFVRGKNTHTSVHMAMPACATSL